MKVIAKKIRPIKNGAGFIKPVLFAEDGSNKYKPASSEIFPETGDVFIFKGYAYIDQKVGDDELFELHEVQKSTKAKGSCLYTATSDTFNPVKQNKFIPIINAKFDIADRYVAPNHNINYKEFFFIRDKNAIYGPLTLHFENWHPIDVDDDRFREFDEVPFLKIEENSSCVLEFKLEHLNGSIVGDYILDIEKLLDVKYTTVYAGTKEDAITWGKGMLQAVMNINKEESEFIRRISQINFDNLTRASDKQKFDAFKQYVGELNEWVNIALPNLLTAYLDTEDGRNRLQSYFEQNSTNFFAHYRKDEIEAANGEIQRKKDEIDALTLEIDTLQQQSNAEGDRIFEGIEEIQKERLKEIIKNEADRKKFLDLFNAKEELEDIKNNYQQLIGQRNQLKYDVEEAKASHQDYLEKKNAIVDAIKNVKDEMLQEKEFAKKLVESKLYSDILNNIDPAYSKTDAQENSTADDRIPALFTEDTDAMGFISEITNRLASTNRLIEHNDVVNYLVTLHQNFLTVFAGSPGIGKTSLVNKLSKVLGAQHHGRFLPISVQKGWTSTKDLIGYYNPIFRKYQPASTQLYKFLKQMNKDYQNGTPYPALILLDEANLSPMEHYWSEFSTMADDDYEKKIRVSDHETLMLSNGMKFVATINYDHTTEILSDRLISRTPIIKLSKTELSGNDDAIDDRIFSSFDYSKIDQWLKPNKEYFKGDVKNRFESIIKKLEDEEDTSLGQPIIVSPRKQKAVEKYCAAGTPLMKNSTGFLALDYAINQHILPLISGRGDAYRKRLIQLQEKLQAMPKSSKHLDRIIHAGDNNFKYYKFFY